MLFKKNIEGGRLFPSEIDSLDAMMLTKNHLVSNVALSLYGVTDFRVSRKKSGINFNLI
jgi:hypothetical protein